MAQNWDDFERVALVGENLIPWIRGETTIMEVFRENGLLEQFYQNSYALPEYNSYLSKIIKQISHRHRHMDILEIGESPPTLFYYCGRLGPIVNRMKVPELAALRWLFSAS